MVLSDDQLDIKFNAACYLGNPGFQAKQEAKPTPPKNGSVMATKEVSIFSFRFCFYFLFFDNWLALENNLYTTTIPQSFLSFIFVTLGTRQVNCIDEVRCFGLLNALV